ncbi:energy-coupling factor ABC transporter ATP-binding protein [Desulfitibacter alkalitolerans]|uniref:energy-coupling factor ABC transporter ATP-binding protein n=1 Tax=Desulfitibacter alkalitolerans TaxID=264641 RepID=UPI0006888020|nr:ATP-binding cassette domain-containing protein [Desulfitibacter alkalitolerans]
MKKPLIEVENLNFGYDKHCHALRDINLTITRGEMIAFTGKNGSGKTTLAKHFNGLLKPSSGRVLIDGNDTAKSTVSQLAQKVGYVFQNPDHQIFNDTVFDEVAFGPKNQGLRGRELEKLVIQSIEAVGLKSYRGEYPYRLSKGQRQRLALASVIAMESEIMVLDEPTTGLDYKEGLEIMELVKKLNTKGRTIIFITHDMGLVADYAKRMVVVSEGEILVDDIPRKIFAMEEVIKRAHLKIPEITQLAQRLGLSKRTILNDAELFQEIIIAVKEAKLNVLCS